MTTQRFDVSDLRILSRGVIPAQVTLAIRIGETSTRRGAS